MSKQILLILGLTFLVVISSCKKTEDIRLVTLRDARFELQRFESVKQSSFLIYGNRPEDHWMHVFEPVDSGDYIRPLIILAPGGGFDPNEIDHSFDLLLPIAEKFAHDGFVVAVINYSTGLYDSGEEYRKIFMEAAYDLKAAIRFFRQDADHNDVFRIHQDWIFMGGWSAGAKIGMYNAYVRSEAELIDYERETIDNLSGFDGSSGNPGYSSKVKGIIAMAGNMIDLSRINVGDPPILCISSDIDNTVNIESQNSHFGIAYGSRPIISQAQSVGLDATLIELLNGFHTDPIKPHCTTCYGQYLDFVVRQLER